MSPTNILQGIMGGGPTNITPSLPAPSQPLQLPALLKQIFGAGPGSEAGAPRMSTGVMQDGSAVDPSSYGRSGGEALFLANQGGQISPIAMLVAALLGKTTGKGLFGKDRSGQAAQPRTNFGSQGGRAGVGGSMGGAMGAGSGGGVGTPGGLY